ncbi:hypothetical protein [Anaerolentibacter hominis]|uniref:hypothetical protein n=1 Tax=Anaerolentibacter hominis TaxID=3079009 RepID=UPI0031B83AB1
MFRLWGKIWKDTRLMKDYVVCDDSPKINRTRKVFSAIDSLCYEFDLPKPIWLDKNIAEFQRHDRTRFTQDNFIESIPFDAFEIMVIEEDDPFVS